MKTLLFFGFFTLLSFGVYSQDFKKLDAKNVDAKQLEFFKKFADDYFSKQVSGSSYTFNTNEATDEMIKMLTAEKQKAVYDQLKSAFGEFKSLEYSQTWTENNAHMVIYRFKGMFDDKNILEIRVVLNYQGKIAGFFVKPWAEELK